MPTGGSITKDFHDLKKNIKKDCDGEVAITKEYDDNIGTFEVTISPNNGCFKEGEFIFEIVMDVNYNNPPKIFCKTAIYHPNINTITSYTGEVCINLTSDSRMKFIIEALVYLMYNPNFGDPLCEVVSFQNFDIDAANSITGGRVGDYVFPVNAGYVNDEGERTEEHVHVHVEGLELVKKYFGIRQYVESTPDDDDDDDDEGNGDGDDDDDDDDDGGGLYEKNSSEDDY